MTDLHALAARWRHSARYPAAPANEWQRGEREALARCADELDAALREQGWRSMDSAPDYQVVLIYVPPFAPMQGTRSGEFGTWMVGARSLIGRDLPVGYEPIAWMPLHPPPAEEPGR